MPSHRWFLECPAEVREQISSLSKSERRSLFAKMADLLAAEDPYSLPGVEKLIEKRFKKGNFSIGLSLSVNVKTPLI